MCEACDTMMNFNPYDEGFEAGQLAEQNRIIALLEANASFFTTIEGGTLVNYADDAIALIKGENK